MSPTILNVSSKFLHVSSLLRSASAIFLLLAVAGCDQVEDQDYLDYGYEDYYEDDGHDETYYEDDSTEPSLPAVSLDEHFELIHYVPDVELGSFQGDTIWVASTNGLLFRSSDRGLNWSNVPLPEESDAISYLKFVGEKGVVVSADGMLMRTSNGGAEWTVIDMKEKSKPLIGDWYHSGHDFAKFSFDDSLENVIWTPVCRLFRSQDGGVTWTSYADPIIETEKRERRCVGKALMVDGELRYAKVEVMGRTLTSGSYLYASRDDGGSWKEICSLDEVALVIKSVISCRQIAEKLPGWNHFGDGLDVSEEALFDFEDDAKEGIFTRGSLPLPASVSGKLPAGVYEDRQSKTFWYAKHGSFAYTEDQGKTWTVKAGLPSYTSATLQASPGAELLLAIADCQAFISDNEGRSWQPVQVPTDCVYSGAILGESKQLLLATDEGLKTSTDLGASWTASDIKARIVLYEEGILWLVDENHLSWSDDGGESWQTVEADGALGYHVCRKAGCVVVSGQSLLRFEADAQGRLAQTFKAELPDGHVMDIASGKGLNEVWVLFKGGELFLYGDGGRTLVSRQRLEDDGGWNALSGSPSGESVVAFGFGVGAVLDRSGEEAVYHPSFHTDSSTVCWVNDDVVLMPQSRGDIIISTDRGRTLGKARLSIPGACLVDEGTTYFIGGALRYKAKPEQTRS